MKNLKVNVIYPAFMGEVNKYGIGAPCTFVRLAGCNLRCYYRTLRVLCDTPEALDGTDSKEMTPKEILKKVRSFNNKLICITGGEPLLQDLTELLVLLVNNGFNIVIETNGTIDISKYRHIRGVSFVLDYKTESTGECGKMLTDNYELLNEDDFVKVVVRDENDFEGFVEWYQYWATPTFNVAVGCFWGGNITNQRLLELLHLNDIEAYLNMQTHKLICLYDKTEDFTDLVIPKEL